MKMLLRPLSLIYRQVAEIKNSLYDRGIIGVYRASCPVVSIGNLTVGGTGKTPITDFILKTLVRENKRVAVVSRSYRADASAPTLVDPSHPHAARYFGDEPVLLAQSNPEVPIYVGPSKWKTAAYACSEGAFDLLLVDDGFQHRKLYRDFNIVILDATEKLENYQVLPQGRAREPWFSLKRANLIIISKCNLSTEEDLKALENRLPEGKEVLYFGYEIRTLRNMKTGEIKSVSELSHEVVFLVSAIARPDVFEKMMRTHCEVSKKSVHFRDHHQYSINDARSLVDGFSKSGASLLVTTEKDAVKLKPLLGNEELWWVATLDVVEISRKGQLSEKVRTLLS